MISIRLNSIVFGILLVLFAVSPVIAKDNKHSAKEFFDAIYGCKPDKIDSLASDSIIVSYPVFQELFSTPALKGKNAVKEFASGFCRRWSNPEITVHEAIKEGDIVVLIWSYKATQMDKNGKPVQESGWGGITYYRFDKKGKVVEEVGEESTPGPFGRIK